MAVQTLAEAALIVRPDYSQVDKGAKAAGAQAGNAVAQGLSQAVRRAAARAGTSAGCGTAGLRGAAVAASKPNLSAGFAGALAALGLGAGIGSALTAGITGALDVGRANDKL